MFALGIVLAVLILTVAFVGTVAAYLAYCAKHPSRKFRAEIAVVGIVLVASLVIRMIIGFASLPDKTFADGVTSFFHAIFSAAAGLTFNSLLELGEVAGGVFSCLYYGIIVYASLVFLALVTVGLSYEFYSLVQSFGMRRSFNYYFIFTSITPDSILLAKDIKEQIKDRRNKKGGKAKVAIIFFENGEESFSRRNKLHRKIMEEGFYYYSDFRRTDSGDTISFLQKFGFSAGRLKKDAGNGRLFNVFAMGDCGGFEGENGGIVFEDLESVLNRYVKGRHGKGKGIPTTVNYYLLTGGEINYESYERRLEDLLDRYCPDEAARESARAKIQVNVFNEATLSSQDLTKKRNGYLYSLGVGAFASDRQPDKNGAYRIAVLGFGKTGQYAMEELYTHTAHLTVSGEGEERTYTPSRFIADIYDVTSDEKSGLFAYNHPLFRCVYGKESVPLSTKETLARADKVGGQAFNALYGACARKGEMAEEGAKEFVERNMGFPVAVFHPQSCFAFPLMDCDRTDAAVKAAEENGIRDIVVALGDDERNIAMANVLIDSFKRAYFAGGRNCRVKIYVNLIERESVKRLDWQSGDEKLFEGNYLAVIPFGCRNDMFSYATIIDDYAAQIYNYGYNLMGVDEGKAIDFIAKISRDYNACRGERALAESWLSVGQFKRKSNRSAQNFAYNYYEYYLKQGGKVDEAGLELLGRLEHERWNRFHISHGWIFGDFDRGDKKVRDVRRAMRHHECLCTYDAMLDGSTKKYDIINVRLGFVESLVIDGGKAE